MGFNRGYYLTQKANMQSVLDKAYKTPSELMKEYEWCIETEDYEKAKAITEVLKPLNYHTEDTHAHILCLWN